MSAHVKLVTSVLVTLTLLQIAASVHKKKIIVKVPHLIKHIHHEHFKPVHVHKVHAKKVEHHHDEHEEKMKQSDGKKSVNKLKGKLKPYGSFTELKPILIQQDIEEHMEYIGDSGEQEDHKHTLGQRQGFSGVPENNYRSKHEFHQSNNWKNKESSKIKKSRYKDAEFFRGSNRVRPIDFASWMNVDASKSEYSGEDWITSGEELGHPGRPKESLEKKREPFLQSFSTGQKNHGVKRRKPKQLHWRSTQVSPQLESDDGWKPIINFSTWNNFNNQGHGFRDHSFSGEDYLEGSNEYNYRKKQSDHLDNSAKKSKPLRKKKRNQKWSKRIAGSENGERNITEAIYQDHIPQYFQLESPNVPDLPQIQPQQLLQELQLHQLRSQPLSSQEVQQNWPIVPQQQNQLTVQQPAPIVWYVQPTPTTQPTPAAKMLWTGHHLEMPQHTMWHVQQHAVGQALPVNQNPSQDLKAFQPVLPLRQQPINQLEQESVAVHHVVPPDPDWPLKREPQEHHPAPITHWEQYVQTSGSDGPASSYKVEVINYMDHKKV